MAHDPVPPMIGRSEAMAILRERVSLLASSDEPVLFLGEPGTGRGLAARTLHALSARGGAPFVALDCAALGSQEPPEPAARALAEARGGVLFLANLEKLDREGGRRIADARGVTGQLRVLASSVRSPSLEAGEGGLLREVADVASGQVVPVPALRDRAGDVLPLARHFIDVVRGMNELPPIQITPATLAILEGYPWPGNVAELRDVVEQAVTVATDGILHPEHLPERVRREARSAEEPGGRSPRRFRDAKRRVVDSFERSYLEDLLAWHRGNVTAAAAQAGMLRSALQRLLRKHELRSSDFRKGPRASAPPRREPT